MNLEIENNRGMTRTFEGITYLTFKDTDMLVYVEDMKYVLDMRKIKKYKRLNEASEPETNNTEEV